MARPSRRPSYASLPPTERRRLLVQTAAKAIGSTALLVAIWYVLPLDLRSGGLTALSIAIGFVLLVIVIGWQIRGILTSTYPAVRAVEALAIILPVFLLTFASAYFLMQQSAPASFTERLTRTDSLYFTVTVFSTVGFGDITPRTEMARVLVTLQMISDIVAIGIGVRVILGAVETAQQGGTDDGTGSGGLTGDT